MAVSAGVATLAFAGPVGPPGVRSAAPASATLVQLTESPVDVLGLEAYTGRYGVAESAGAGEADNGDFGDPDGMLRRIGLATRQARTAADPAKNWAQAQLTSLEVKAGRKPFLKVASLDSHAECVPPPVGPWALAYNRTDSGMIQVLGHLVRPGRTELSVTGAELGAAGIGKSTLTLVVTPFQDPAAQSRQGYARAGLDIVVTAVLKDKDGRPVYDGPVMFLRLGEVEAQCTSRPPTSSTTSATSTSSTTSATSATSTAGSSASATISMTTGSSGATTTPGGAASPPSSGGPAGRLPGTGIGALPAQAVVLLVLLGAGLLLLASARKRDSR
ncbi:MULTISPECIES: hypothetical protein [Amycolatopsis]|uniref:Gram-positive cocci surface proteins LPxTG domain-containing protein n=1 Tax=Amycolatopsis bullii TaxID=941987 RepID=A0ABQ3KPX2_9PSEU|nr:hypothetical protein [Amycolatopsis bullii]GHG43046.1 hypothetical protein GCM10017567_76360 [Amycolatopsis bullii]